MRFGFFASALTADAGVAVSLCLALCFHDAQRSTYRILMLRTLTSLQTGYTRAAVSVYPAPCSKCAQANVYSARGCEPSIRHARARWSSLRDISFWRDLNRRKQVIQDPAHGLLAVCKARVSVRNLLTHLSPHPPSLATLATTSVYAFDIRQRKLSGIRVYAVAFFKFILIQALCRPAGRLSMNEVRRLKEIWLELEQMPPKLGRMRSRSGSV